METRQLVRSQNGKQELQKRKQRGFSLVLPLIGGILTGIATPQPAYSKKPTVCRMKNHSKLSVSCLKKRYVLTPFLARGTWNINAGSFSHTRTLYLSNKKTALMAAVDIKGGANPKKQFSVIKFSKQGRKWRQTKTVYFSLSRLEKSFGTLKGAKIVVEEDTKSDSILFYIVPDNGVAKGIQNEDSITAGLPVAVFRYDLTSGKTKEEGIKNTLSP